MSKLIQVSQIQASPDGTYINGEVRAVLSRAVEPKNPKAPWKALLADSTGIIDASFWGGSIAHWGGKQIVISGKGMKVQEYNGTKTLSVGDKASVGFGGAPGTAAQEEQMAGDPVPQKTTAEPDYVRQNSYPQTGHGSPQYARQNHPTAVGTPINGQTVGMAVKLAGDLLVSENKDFIAEADWAGRLRAAAAQIIAVSRSLENGTPFERVDQELPPF